MRNRIYQCTHNDEHNENLSWCKPVLIEYRRKYAVIVESDVDIIGLTISGKIDDSNDYLESLTAHLNISGITQLAELYKVKDLFATELDCQDCPYFKAPKAEIPGMPIFK